MPHSVVLLTAKTAIEYNMEGVRDGSLWLYYQTIQHQSPIVTLQQSGQQPNHVAREIQPTATNQYADFKATNAMDKKFLDKAMEIFEKEIENADFNVDQWAIKMGIARTKLFTKLKAISGQTPGEIMMTIRLKKQLIYWEIIRN